MSSPAGRSRPRSAGVTSRTLPAPAFTWVFTTTPLPVGVCDAFVVLADAASGKVQDSWFFERLLHSLF